MMLQIIHRRLGVRNVLLQQQANGLVAKLIGFGPSAEDMDSQGGAGVSQVLCAEWKTRASCWLSKNRPNNNIIIQLL